MKAIVDALEEQYSELASLLDSLDDAAWQAPTRCEGWSAGDVVLHLAQTDELALASARSESGDGLDLLAGGPDGQGTVDDGAAASVERERGMPPAALLDRWRTGARALLGTFAVDDPHRRVPWVVGRLSMQTLATTRLAEWWIHTGDIAEPLGLAQEPTDRLEHIARLAWRTLPYAFERDGRKLTGPVAFHLDAPSGARWNFVPDVEPATIIEGAGAELCLVAARRVAADDTMLRGTGPDVAAVLELVRTYA
jgi:uncharacterized protein (TIGR03084 family)